MRKPYVGDVVLFRNFSSNGAIEQAAIVTRVWSDTSVNLMVFADSGPIESRTSVPFGEDQALSYAWRWGGPVGLGN